MVLFPAKAEEDTRLKECVAKLLGQNRPELVWVDNLPQNYRFWDVYPLFTAGGLLTGDVILPLGDYCLILTKDSRLSPAGALEEGSFAGGLSWRVEGKVIFRCPEGRFTVSGADIDGEGTIRFSFSCKDLSVLGAGIRYAVPIYDSEVERTVFRSLYSPVFSFEDALELGVCFFPAQVDKNRWEVAADASACSGFQSVRLQGIHLRLPAGFAFQMAAGVDVNGYESVYFTPSGTAEMTGMEGSRATEDSAEGMELMPGLSGTEYIGTGGSVVFHPGGKAFFGEGELAAFPTTAYLSFPGGVYYTQPQHSSFYRTREEGIYECALLPGVDMQDAEVPVFPFGGIARNAKEAAALENGVLCPLRRKAVEQQIGKGFRGDGEVSYAVTRSGMMAAYTRERMVWMQVVPVEEAVPGIGYTYMETKFWFSLLAAELFWPLTDLKERAKTPCGITESRLESAERGGYTDAGKLRELCGQVYLSEEELMGQVWAKGAAWNEAIRDACSHFNREIAGWEFHFAPWNWKKEQTLAICKLTDKRTMEECMEEPSSWSLEQDEEETARAKAYFQRVKTLENRFDAGKLREILYDRGFRGSVFFQVRAPLSGLPEELSFLAGGIDPEKFYASYVSYPSVSAASGRNSGADVLLVYEKKEKTNFEKFREFGFLVKNIRLDIREGKIYDFRAKVELLVNRLFGIDTAGMEGADESCAVVFNGSYQRDENGGYYAFEMDAPAEFVMRSGGLLRVSMESAGLRASGREAAFVLGGSVKLTGDCGVDLLSYDTLSFGGLKIQMVLGADGYRFEADYRSLALFPEKSVLRDASFGALFPAKISRMLWGNGRSPQDMGYMTLKLMGYGDAEKLGKEWTGFVWRIETGNLGGLAAAARLTLEILTAFGPDSDSGDGAPCFYCGMKIDPLMNAGTFSLPLQGVVSLGFDAVELKKEEDFYFRFRNFSLTILGRRFPDTNNDLYLIGDKDGNLGWYGAAQ